MKPGLRRTATQSLGTSANINRVVKANSSNNLTRSGSAGAQTIRSSTSSQPDSDKDKRRPAAQSQSPPRTVATKAANPAVSNAVKPSSEHYKQQPSSIPGVKELLTQQLHAARQDLAQRAYVALEQLEHACLDSFQLVEERNAQLRQECDRLNAENERLHAQFGSGGGAHMGGTGESPAPLRQSPSKEPVTPVGSQAQVKGALSPPGNVMPPSALRPKTPNCADGPPTMGISMGNPGVVQERSDMVTQIEVMTGDESEDAGSFHKASEKKAAPEKKTASILSPDDEDEDDDEEDDDGTSMRAQAKRHRSVFADADKMKAKVREAVMKKEYDVRNAYKSTGICAWIAKSNFFDHLTLAVILVNAVWISIDLDFNQAEFILDADPVYKVAEFSFCTYFTIEVIIRFIAFKSKFDCLMDSWFVFDSCLVMTMLFDTGVITLVVYMNGGGGNGSPGGLADPTILRMFRMLKLTRMARMVRLLRAMPELMILIKGIVVAFRSVLFTLALLLIFIYLFAIMFRSLTEDSPALREDLFPSTRAGMLNLLLQGTLPDHEALVMKLWNESVVYGLLAIFFILMTSLTVMNMLVGVLVEVVGVVSSVEKEQMNVQFVYSKLNELLTTGGLDADGDKRISKAEFESLLLNPKAARMVQEVGVDVVGLVDFSEYLFQNDATLSFPEFMDLVLQLRGSNTATVKDVVDLRKFICSQVMEINDMFKKSQGIEPDPRPRSASPTRDLETRHKLIEFSKQLPGPASDTPQSWAAPRPPSGPSSNNNSNVFTNAFGAMWPSNANKHANNQLLDEEV